MCRGARQPACGGLRWGPRRGLGGFGL